MDRPIDYGSDALQIKRVEDCLRGTLSRVTAVGNNYDLIVLHLS